MSDEAHNDLQELDSFDANFVVLKPKIDSIDANLKILEILFKIS